MASTRNPETAALMQRMATSMAKGAPTGWQRSTLSADASRHATGGTGVINLLADGKARPGSLQLHKHIKKVYELDQTGADDLAVELAVYPTGRFEAITSRAISRRPHTMLGTSDFVYVLRPDVAPPDVADAQPGPRDATQAGNAEEAVRLLRRHLEKRAEIFGWESGGLERLPAPLTAAQIDDLEQALGSRLLG